MKNISPTETLKFDLPDTVINVKFSSQENIIIILLQSGSIHTFPIFSKIAPKQFKGLPNTTNILPRPRHNNEVLVLSNEELHLLDLNTLLTTSIYTSEPVKSVSWNFKGSELIVGTDKLVKLKANGDQLISYPLPEEYSEAYTIFSVSVISESSILVTLNSEESYPCFIVNSSSSDEISWSSLEPCYSFGDERFPNWYNAIISKWSKNSSFPSVVISALANSTDIGLYTENEIIDFLEDSDKATIPFKEDTGKDPSPVGLALDFTSTDMIYEPYPGAEEAADPQPILWCLDEDGDIHAWSLIYKPGIIGKSISLLNIMEHLKLNITEDASTETEGFENNDEKDEQKKETILDKNDSFSTNSNFAKISDDKTEDFSKKETETTETPKKAGISETGKLLINSASNKASKIPRPVQRSPSPTRSPLSKTQISLKFGESAFSQSPSINLSAPTGEDSKKEEPTKRDVSKDNKETAEEKEAPKIDKSLNNEELPDNKSQKTLSADETDDSKSTPFKKDENDTSDRTSESSSYFNVPSNESAEEEDNQGDYGFNSENESESDSEEERDEEEDLESEEESEGDEDSEAGGFTQKEYVSKQIQTDETEEDEEEEEEEYEDPIDYSDYFYDSEDEDFEPQTKDFDRLPTYISLDNVSDFTPDPELMNSYEEAEMVGIFRQINMQFRLLAVNSKSMQAYINKNKKSQNGDAEGKEATIESHEAPEFWSFSTLASLVKLTKGIQTAIQDWMKEQEVGDINPYLIKASQLNQLTREIKTLIEKKSNVNNFRPLNQMPFRAAELQKALRKKIERLTSELTDLESKINILKSEVLTSQQSPEERLRGIYDSLVRIIRLSSRKAADVEMLAERFQRIKAEINTENDVFDSPNTSKLIVSQSFPDRNLRRSPFAQLDDEQDDLSISLNRLKLSVVSSGRKNPERIASGPFGKSYPTTVSRIDALTKTDSVDILEFQHKSKFRDALGDAFRKRSTAQVRNNNPQRRIGRKLY